MNRKGFFLILGWVLFFAIIGSASAVDFRVVNSTISIEKNYAPGEFAKGSFKASFKNQTDANFTSTFAGGVSLLDLLEKSGYAEGLDFTCVPAGCEKIFKSSGSGNTEITISPASNKTYGFKLNGKEATINDLTFKVHGSGSSSCQNQVKIDLLGDGSYELFNSRYIDETCTQKNYGCFRDVNTEKATIPSDSYCEKMNLSAAPAYGAGARVEKGTNTGELTMEMYGTDGSQIGECTLPDQTSSVEDISCIIEHSSINRFEAFVCIKAETGTNYKIRTETDNPCGMIGADPEGELVADYEIFAQGLKYDILDMVVNKTVFEKLNSGEDLVGLLQNYLDERYEGDCSSGCIIPMKISGAGEDVTVNNIELNYDVTGLTGRTSGLIYDIIEDKPKISSGDIALSLENMRFVVPEGTGSKLFELKLSNNLVLRTNLNVSAGFGFDVTPKNVFLGLGTEFKVLTNYSVSSINWEFGDGASETTTGKSVKHMYNQSGSYNLVAEVKKTSGERSRKSFTISVGNARQSAELLLARAESRLPNVTSQINAFPAWIKAEINRKLNLSSAREVLNETRLELASAVSDEDYISIVARLIALDMPFSISTSLSGNVPIAVMYNNLDVKNIEEISRNTSDDANALKNAIISWMEGNYNANIGFEVISKYTDSGKEDIFTSIKADITPKKSDSKPSYFIINYPASSLIFKDNVSIGALSSGAYISLESGATKSIEFLVPGAIELSDLGIYISPGVKELSVVTIAPVKPKAFPTSVLVWLIVGVIVLTFIVYIALQEWYKRRYEGYLFKSKDDLYNLINFISNSRRAGMSGDETTNKLKKSGWKGEQIEYAARKLEGRRTGMYEIPIFRLFEQKKLNEEMKKRQQSTTGNQQKS